MNTTPNAERQAAATGALDELLATLLQLATTLATERTHIIHLASTSAPSLLDGISVTTREITSTLQHLADVGIDQLVWLPSEERSADQ